MVPTQDQQILQQDIQDPAVPTGPTPEEIQLQQEQQKVAEELRQTRIDELLRELMKKAEEEDIDLRYNMLRNCKRNDLYFNNIQKIFYDDVAKDVKSLDTVREELNLDSLDDIKTVNIYRAFAESLIAAATVAAPNVEFTPDDAEDPNDIETAEAYTKISELVSRHNHGPLMLIKASTILFNCGTIAGFNYYKKDPSYGVTTKPKTTVQNQKPVNDLRCANCNALLDSGLPVNAQPQQPMTCPNCGTTAAPVAFPRIELVDEVTEWEDTPKGRSGFDIFGPTHAKVSLYARKQETCGYLILRLEDHIAKFKSVYKDHKYKIKAGGGDTYLYERWSRIPIEYQGVIPKDITTARTAWFRPWYYNLIEQDEDIDILNEEFPDGCMVTIIGDTVVDKQHEKLDDRWTLSFDPRSNFVHGEPPGNALIPMQDSETDIFNLGMQSIEYGIPETFVNPRTLNLAAYAKQRNTPGMMTHALPPGPDKGLADGFHTIKAATMSNEYTSFAGTINTKAQFVTGAFPSLFGGAMQAGSQTATEYTESRSRALQRLQLTWQMLSVFWNSLIYKCVRDYATNLREDEQFAKKENGTFINIWIRMSSLSGKVGEVEPEINGQLPQSWSQKKDFFMSLITLQNPEIGTILLHPNNSENIKLITGMPDFYIPGENDRNKQYAEYYELSQGEVIQPGQPQQNQQQPGSMQDPTSGLTPGQAGMIQPPQQQGPPQPSVPVDIDVDDHIVHMLVLKNILVSTQGMQLYRDNPAGYTNCIAHYRQHELAQQAKTIAPSGTTAPGQPAESAAPSTQG